MIRFLITAIVIFIFLMLMGATDAAKWVINGALSIVKWVVIIGVVFLIGSVIFSDKRNK